MFHNIPPAMLARMREMETQDERDRSDGTHIDYRLRQIPPETGQFLALLAAGAPAGRVIEVGASGGYSGMWLSLACQQRGDRLTTFELLPHKADWARQAFAVSGAQAHAEVVTGDARQHLGSIPNIAFCFLDAEKDVYIDCSALVIPNLVPGGWLVADNLISHADELVDYRAAIEADPRLDALVVPIGKGVLIARKIA